VLIYSLDQHGISLNTLYSRCEAHLSQKLAPGDLGVSKGMLLAIKDGGAEEEHRAIFGAWIAEGLKLNKGKGYSGGGESYVLLFRLASVSDFFASFLWKYVDGILKVFKATGKNNYVALCEPDYISFGGGSVRVRSSHILLTNYLIGMDTMAFIWTTPYSKARLHLVQHLTTNRYALAASRGT
jgi:hypothetical protein